MDSARDELFAAPALAGHEDRGRRRRDTFERLAQLDHLPAVTDDDVGLSSPRERRGLVLVRVAVLSRELGEERAKEVWRGEIADPAIGSRERAWIGTDDDERHAIVTERERGLKRHRVLTRPREHHVADRLCADAPE